jgi:hypothetical protein
VTQSLDRYLDDGFLGRMLGRALSSWAVAGETVSVAGEAASVVGDMQAFHAGLRWQFKLQAKRPNGSSPAQNDLNSYVSTCSLKFEKSFVYLCRPELASLSSEEEFQDLFKKRCRVDDEDHV